MSASPEFVDIDFRIEDGVATITLARADGLNAFSTPMYREIRTALRLADLDPAVTCIIIDSRGPAFGVGGDLKEMLSYLAGPDTETTAYRFRDDLPFSALRAVRTPVVAAVHGLCVGGGFGLATGCDITVLSTETRLGIPEAKVGLIDGLALSTLYGHVPRSALNYLLFTGKLISAAEAVRLGLALEAVPPAELNARCRQIATEISASSSAALSEYKRITRSYERPHHLDDVMDSMLRTPETQQRIKEFFDRGDR